MNKRAAGEFRRGIFPALVVSLIWGVEPLIFRDALSAFSPEDIVWLRFAGALPLLLLLAQCRTTYSVSALLAGIFLAFNYLGFLKGISLIGPSQATVLLQSSAFIFVALASFTGQTKMKKGQWGALLVFLTGYVCYFRDLHTIANSEGFLGYGWILLSATSWAIYAILTRRNDATVSPHWLTSQSFFVALLLISFFSAPSHLLTASDEQIPKLLLIVLFTTSAYVSLGLALRYGQPAVVGPLIATNPLFTLLALALEARLLGGPGISPPLGGYGLVGVILVVLGVGLASGYRDTVVADSKLRRLREVTRCQDIFHD